MKNIKRQDILLSFFMMIVVICVSVCIVLFVKQLYYFDIEYLNFEDNVWLSVDEIKENYDVLIQYQSIFYRGELSFPDFWMSETGAKHFAEVKVVFEVIQVIAMAGGAAAIGLIIKKFRDKDHLFFRYSAITTLVTPTIIGTLAALNFDKAFTIFHQIVFRNNDWIFDPSLDPVILILPEDFFMHCFIAIIILTIVFCILFYIISRRLIRYWEKA